MRPIATNDQCIGAAAWRPFLILLFMTVALRAAKADDRVVAVPNGTILAVRLNVTISSTKCKPGQEITGRIMQRVPLPSGIFIREGSRVRGQIVAVNPVANGTAARISLQIDKLIIAHQAISIVTNLRAIAGFMEIAQAQTPPIGPGESDVYRWLTTQQVGGDLVYGEGGPVTASTNSDEILGREANGGVLGLVRSKNGTKCRGAIDGNETSQALWVFSTDACGTYGLQHLQILHAGRTDPVGVIVLASNNSNLKIPAGTGMLLRVIASGQNLSRDAIHYHGDGYSQIYRTRVIASD
jgi:hypothetical protein